MNATPPTQPGVIPQEAQEALDEIWSCMKYADRANLTHCYGKITAFVNKQPAQPEAVALSQPSAATAAVGDAVLVPRADLLELQEDLSCVCGDRIDKPHLAAVHATLDRILAALYASSPPAPGELALFQAGQEAGLRLARANNCCHQSTEEHIASWLRAQANAEKEPKSRAAFIEAHNAARQIIGWHTFPSLGPANKDTDHDPE